jgi:hypothetical protein
LNCASNRLISGSDAQISAKRADIITIDQQFFDNTTGNYHYKINLQNSKAFLGVKAMVVDTARE